MVKRNNLVCNKMYKNKGKWIKKHFMANKLVKNRTKMVIKVFGGQ